MAILKIRDKVQEYPNKLLKGTLMYMLKDDDNGDKAFKVGF